MATGIGVTPFSSILQSIMYRYHSAQRECPRCNLRWLTDLGDAMQNLKKVDFIWINRDQKSFEWFLNLLTKIEADQEVDQDYSCNNHTGQFLSQHLFVVETCSCPFVWYFCTLFWDDIMMIWNENIVYLFNWEKNLFWTNKLFVYLIFINKLLWYRPKIMYQNIVQKDMNVF